MNDDDNIYFLFFSNVIEPEKKINFKLIAQYQIKMMLRQIILLICEGNHLNLYFMYLCLFHSGANFVFKIKCTLNKLL